MPVLDSPRAPALEELVSHNPGNGVMRDSMMTQEAVSPSEVLIPETIRALRDQVIVRRDEAIKMVNGIVLPDGVNEKPATGEILSIGPEVKSVVIAGDRVAFSKYAGQPLPGFGNVVVMSDRELLCVLPSSGGTEGD